MVKGFTKKQWARYEALRRANDLKMPIKVERDTRTNEEREAEAREQLKRERAKDDIERAEMLAIETDERGQGVAVLVTQSGRVIRARAVFGKVGVVR